MAYTYNGLGIRLNNAHTTHVGKVYACDYVINYISFENHDHGNYVFAIFTGHIYDMTLDIYFAEARFYDANNRSWLAMDPVKDGINWYQYCYGAPINYMDPDGENPILAYLLYAVVNGTVEGILGAGINLAGQMIQGKEINWKEVGSAGALAFAGGTIEAFLGGEWAGLVFGVTYTGLSSFIQSKITNEPFDVWSMPEDMAYVGAASFLSTGSTKVLEELGIDSLPKLASTSRHALEWLQAYTLDVLRNKISWSKLVEQIGWMRRALTDKFFSYSGS